MQHLCCAPSVFTAPHFPTHYDSISWEYVALTEIRTSSSGYNTGITLICEEDEQSGFFAVRCDRAHMEYLAPYIELQQRGEQPVLPVYRTGGHTQFCITGAVYDYPELGAIRQRVCDRLSLLEAFRMPPPPDCL